MRKTIILIITCFVTGTLAQAQFEHLKEVKLQSAEDFNEYSEQVLDCSDYLLLTPYDKKDTERQVATDFIVRWMKGSPVFALKISEDITMLTEEKEDLIGLYITCFAKHALDQFDTPLNKTQIESIAVNSFLEYCGNPSNKVKATKQMKEMIALKNSGELASLQDYFLTTKQ